VPTATGNLESREKLRVPVLLFEAIEHCRGGEATIEDRLSGEARHHVGDRLMKACRRLVAVEVVFQPADLGCHVAGIAGNAGQVPQTRFLDHLGLGLGAAIHPDQAGAERPFPGVHGKATVQLTGDAQCADLAWGDLGVDEGLADRRAQGPLPQPRRLLGPSRSRVVGRVTPRGAAEHAKVVRGDDADL
jgi:hypothetical protein